MFVLDSETSARLKLVQLEILDELIRICTKFNLCYFLMGGTLLGAIRHKGFIPWDDDIDIGMPREDYEKLIRICKKDLNDNFYLLSPETYPPYWTTFVKICKKNTLLFEKNTRNHTGPENRGIFIDIFPYDNTMNIVLLQKIKRYLINNLHALILIKRGVVFPGIRFFKLKKTVSNFFSFKQLHIFLKSIMMFGIGKSRYLITWCGIYGDTKETFPLDVFFPLAIAEFEGKKLPILKQWDVYLSQIYGDYMQLPPEKDRISHSIELLVFDTTKNE